MISGIRGTWIEDVREQGGKENTWSDEGSDNRRLEMIALREAS